MATAATVNSEYPAIADHGLIGDLQTLALVSDHGAVNFFCVPRFDSPTIFASLLDAERGGHFTITVEGEQVTTTQMYLADSAILITRFFTPEGVGEVVDFMPVTDPTTPSGEHRIIRILRVVRGTVAFSLQCRPRIDYGTATHTLTVDGNNAWFQADTVELHLECTASIQLTADGTDAVARITLNQGRTAGVMLTTRSGDAAASNDASGRAGSLEPGTLQSAFENTLRFWERWLRRCTYRGRWQQQVKRSAITLKLMIYAPSGAPVAAATMGLPEQEGGERNWDYRYTWIRDGSLTIAALNSIGFRDEAVAFSKWLADRLSARDSANGEPLQILYRIDGDPDCTEQVLEQFEGWRESAPVRAGNGAMDQLQLDIYGETAYCLSHSLTVQDTGGYDGWHAVAIVLDWLCNHWDRADAGIWETRGGAQNFTFSRVMSWAALDRGLKMAWALSRSADTPRWTQMRDTIATQVLDQAWDAERKAFVQHYGSDVLDASLLLMPKVGFISSRDPRWLATLDAMDADLVVDSLVYRYNPSASPDGLKGSEGTFSLCSFLYVEALARAGRINEARYAFDKMLTYANHVGLYAEEIGPTGQQLGNFPQAFTHLALINAATALDDALDQAEADEIDG